MSIGPAGSHSDLEGVSSSLGFCTLQPKTTRGNSSPVVPSSWRMAMASTKEDVNREELRSLLNKLESAVSSVSVMYRMKRVDGESSREADATFFRVQAMLRRLTRANVRQTWQGGEAELWMNMYTGTTRRFRNLQEIVRKVQVENRIVKHWRYQTLISKKSSGSLSLTPVSSQGLLQLDAWDALNVFEVEQECQQPLTNVFLGVWKARKLGSLSKAKEKKVVEFIRCLEDNYKQNPYHNRIHAADVTLAAVYFWASLAQQDSMASYFTEVDLLVILVAAAIHDVAHPAFGNDFLVKSRHFLALRYNDRSVLENFHSATAFELMKDKRVPLLEHNLPSPPVAALRTRVIDMVLATDMAFHKKLVEDCNAEVERHRNPQDIDKLVLEQTIIHMADLCHPLRPFAQHKDWSVRITEEFFGQGDREKELGFVPMSLCDRQKAPSLAKGQLGFLNFVIQPAWKPVARLLQDAGMPPGDCLRGNLEEWERQAKDESSGT